jgi:outer membrane murein-binding lipoprotein Lpp
VKAVALLAAMLLAGCASIPPMANPPVTKAPVDTSKAEIESLKARLAAEVAERERLMRAAARREDALRKQLEAMKAIERGILEREDRVRFESR